MTSVLGALQKLDGKAELGPEDALSARQAMFGATITVTREEADALVQLNRHAAAVSPEWRVLYLEALSDFVVREAEPPGYVDQERADWLMAATPAQPKLGHGEIELLVHVLANADVAPADLSAFAVERAKAAVLAEGRLSAEAVELLRQLVHAPASDGGLSVTRSQAEALLEINDACRGAQNDLAWTDVFVRAVASSVLSVQTYHPIDAAEERREEAWLADRRKPFDVSALATEWLHPKALMAAMKEPAPDLRKAWQDRDDAEDAADAAAETISSDKAHWLTGRLGHGGALDANEQALVRFLMQNARAIDPALQPLEAAAAPSQPIGAPSTGAQPMPSPPVFGHRKTPLPQAG